MYEDRAEEEDVRGRAKVRRINRGMNNEEKELADEELSAMKGISE